MFFKRTPTYKDTLFACYLGYITQAAVVNLAPVLFIVFQNRYEISFEKLGRLIFINFVSQLIVDYFAVKNVDKIGVRPCAVTAHIFSAIGLLGLGLFPLILPEGYAYYGLIAAVILYAIGGGLIEVLVSPIVDAMPGDAKASSMSLLHSFYCWGQVAVVLISTLLLKVIGDELWYIVPIVWSILPIFNMLNFLRVPIPAITEEGANIPIKTLMSSRIFLLALLLMTCAGAAEQVMSQWASLFAEKGLHVSKVVGDLLGPCMFAVFMGTGRALYGIFGAKLNMRKALLICAGLCIVCYVTASLAAVPLLSLAGCAFCGLAVSLMWPGMLSMTAERYPGGGASMFGLLAIFGDVGCSIGPWLSGAVSSFVVSSGRPEETGLKAGILAAIVFPIIMMAGVLMLKDASQKKKMNKSN